MKKISSVTLFWRTEEGEEIEQVIEIGLLNEENGAMLEAIEFNEWSY